MPRPEEANIVKGMKAAKTASEMTKSWLKQRPGCEASPGFDFYSKRKPEMVFTYAHNALTQMLDRGILDPKTRYLIILACYMMAGHWKGALPQCCNAKAAGATEEEILEVAFIVCYAVAKTKNADTNEALSAIFSSPYFKNTKPLAKKR